MNTPQTPLPGRELSLDAEDVFTTEQADFIERKLTEMADPKALAAAEQFIRRQVAQDPNVQIARDLSKIADKFMAEPTESFDAQLERRTNAFMADVRRDHEMARACLTKFRVLRVTLNV